MEGKIEGSFSLSILSLQAHLNTLLDGFGGDEATAVLDTLGTLSSNQQKAVLPILKRVLEKIASYDEDVLSLREQELQEFEESLYQDLLTSINKEMKEEAKPSLEVIEGGKDKVIPLRPTGVSLRALSLIESSNEPA